ncbi:hypothetical protein L6164_033919 [Bauhinia variegata]|uniref:Uncharacterized protein n=1 Tax=Bauhinia variegata TaxID=167791 RepID=A0ACB9KTF9_BAUVA|nr:hypothetical protein L6164_033919 [Bauhinia variegata]
MKESKRGCLAASNDLKREGHINRSSPVLICSQRRDDDEPRAHSNFYHTITRFLVRRTFINSYNVERVK